MPECEDLRLGGILDETGITGGLTINGTALAVQDWSGLFGHTGISYTPVEVSGRAGSFPVGDGLAKSRFPTLNMRIRSLAECEPLEDPIDVLFEKTDEFLALLAESNGQYLEVDHPDGSKRFIKVYALDAAQIAQPRDIRRLSVPLYSPDTYWMEGDEEQSAAVTGPDSFVVGGTVNIYDALINFSGDGTLAHLDQDWSMTVDGSTGTVHIDVGERTVMQAGVHADQLFTPTNRLWGWFTPGTNNVQSDIPVSILWRNQYN